MKKKRVKSIRRKLILVTLLMFLVFIVSEVVFQTVFFEKYFTWKKTNDFKAELKEFEFEYYNEIDNWKGTIEIIKAFEQKSEAKIVILENDGTLSYITNFEDSVKDVTKLNDVKSIITDWISKPDSIINIQNSEDITYTVENEYYDFNYLVCISPIKKNNTTVKIIFAITPLNEVKDTIGVLNDFYSYFYIIAILIVLILSIFYSNLISIPLINLNKKAKKMAQLDFTEKCDNGRNDEIGYLAKTLDFLADNLKDALNSLKESNEQLKDDIQKEKKLEKMRREFVASVSHELKTPISLIEGYAEGLKDNIFDEEDKDFYIEVIIDESRKMGNLVNDMLQLSKFESGSISLDIKQFDIVSMVNSYIRKLSPIAENEGNKRIIAKYDPSLSILAYGDENRIEKVVNNYMTNAVRYTKSDKNIYVDIAIVNNQVYVEVENEGETIPKEEMEMIWNKFYRIDKSGNKNYGGTGLGLSIVKNILDLHKSSYGVENTDLGVKFYFTLKYK
ncbi:sensor histidine kinase [Clostridium sp. DL1XJH146]